MLWIQTPKGGSESVSPLHSTFNSYKATADQYLSLPPWNTSDVACTNRKFIKPVRSQDWDTCRTAPFPIHLLILLHLVEEA